MDKVKNFLAGYKTFSVMGLALGVALFQHFVAPIPAIESLPGGQEAWDISVILVAIGLRFVTHKPVSLAEMGNALLALNKARSKYNELNKEEVE